MLDHMNTCVGQAWAVPALDHLNAPDSLEDSLQLFLLSCRVDDLSPKTIEDYYQKVNTFIKFCHRLGIESPRKVDINHARLFILERQKTCGPHSVKDYFCVVRRFFNWLTSEGILECNPMATLKTPRIPKKIIRPFSRRDIENLLSLCSSDRFLHVRNRAVVLLFLDTGLRLAELSNIQMKHIDFDRETIKVMGKGAKERVVRMGKTTQRALLKYLLVRGGQHPCLWVTEERKPMKQEGIQIAIKRLCLRAEITDAKPGPHTFRHTAAINYLRNGGDLFTLQNMLGHSTLEMTRKYTSSLGAEDMIRVHRKASPVDRMFLK